MNKLFAVHITMVGASYVVFFVTFCSAILYLIQDYNLKTKHLGFLFDRLPDLSFLDKLIYRSIGIGFPLLSLAIISGILLAKSATGSYLSYGVREIYIVALWCFYAAILHVRMTSRIRGRKVAILSILAFAVIIFSLFSTCGGM